MADTAHVDTFARDNLPPRDQWPEFRFSRPELQYPERLNCAVAFLDRWVEEGRGDEPCLICPTETLTYRALQERVNRICNVLVHRLGFVAGNRVLLRSANNPMMVAAYLAVLKAGGIVVATMPLLRAKEIAYPLKRRRSPSRSATIGWRTRWSEPGRWPRICSTWCTGARDNPTVSKP